MKHPIQPVQEDSHGVLRFKENSIVRYLLDSGPFDLNHLAAKDFSNEDREQFAQLIGYSLSGFGELSFVSDETHGAAEKQSKGIGEEDARNEYLRNSLEDIKNGLREPIARLYGIHPDDLGQ